MLTHIFLTSEYSSPCQRCISEEFGLFAVVNICLACIPGSDATFGRMLGSIYSIYGQVLVAEFELMRRNKLLPLNDQHDALSEQLYEQLEYNRPDFSS